MEAAIKIKVGAEVDDLKKGLKNAENTMKDFGNKVKTGSNQAAFALMNLGRVAQDAPFGFIGIQNNINPLLESFQRLQKETGSTALSLKALAAGLMGGAGIGLAVSAATALLTVLTQNGFFKTAKAADTLKSDLAYLRAEQIALNAVMKKANNEAAQQLTTVSKMVAALHDEGVALKKKANILKELQEVSDKHFGNLKLEKGVVEGLTVAYQKYADNIYLVAKAKGASQQIEVLANKVVSLTDKIRGIGEQFTLTDNNSLIGGVDGAKKKYEELGKLLDGGVFQSFENIKRISELTGKSEKEINSLLVKRSTLKTQEERALAQIFDLSKFISQNDLVQISRGNEKVKKIKEAKEELIKFKNVDTINLAPNEKPKVVFFEVKAPKGLHLLDQIIAYQEKMQQGYRDIADTITSTLGNAFQSTFETIATGGQNALGVFANAIKQVIVKLVAAAATAAVLAAIIGAATGGGNFGAGAKNFLGGFKSLFSQLGGLPKFAKGGAVNGPTLAMVGDNPSGKEYMLPEESLSDLASRLNTGGGGYMPDVRLSGQDLVIAFNRANNARGRTY